MAGKVGPATICQALANKDIFISTFVPQAVQNNRRSTRQDINQHLGFRLIARIQQDQSPMWTPKDGNRVLLILAMITLTAWSFPLRWGTYHMRQSDLKHHFKANGVSVDSPDSGASYDTELRLASSKVGVTGLHGQALIGPLALPYRLAPVSILGCLSFILLNTIRFSGVPRSLLLALVSLGLLLFGIIMIDLVARGGFGVLALGWLPCLLGGIVTLRWARHTQQS